MITRLRDRSGVTLPLRELFVNPTVAGLADTIDRARAGWQSPDTLRDLPVRLSAGPSSSDRPPLYVVHPVGGQIFHYGAWAAHLGRIQPFYAFVARGLDGKASPRHSIEEMAEAYLAGLLEQQPEGPYHLGGWSLGGVIAFEMAHKLSALGHRVERLALIDSRSVYEAGGSDGEIEKMRAFAWDLGLRSKDFASEESLGEDPAIWLERVRELAQERGLLPVDLEPERLRIFYRVFKAHLSAAEDYRPEPYGGSVALFRAEHGRVVESEPEDLGWRALVSGSLEIESIPGDHHSILREPQVETLGTKLLHYLMSMEQVL